MAAAEIVDADDEETLGIDWLAGPDHVVPPAGMFVLLAVIAGYMMRAGQRMANQHRIAFVGVELAIGFIHQGVVRQRSTAAQRNGLIEARGLRRHNAYGSEIGRMHAG